MVDLSEVHDRARYLLDDLSAADQRQFLRRLAATDPHLVLEGIAGMARFNRIRRETRDHV